MKTTKDYNLFGTVRGNRPVELRGPRAKALALSMAEHGWLDAYPLMAQKNSSARLKVIDGQHRLAIAKDLRLPVKYVIEKKLIDMAIINSTSKTWTMVDYVHRYAAQGNKNYTELVAFQKSHAIPINLCALLLAGSEKGNGATLLRTGQFKVEAPAFANEIMGCVYGLLQSSPIFKKTGAIKAVISCYRLKYFDQKRLVKGAASCSRISPNTTSTAAFLELFEDLYNFRRKVTFPLKFDADVAAKKKSGYVTALANKEKRGS